MRPRIVATPLRGLRPNGVSLVFVAGLFEPPAPVGSFNPIRSGAPSLAPNVAENQLARHHRLRGKGRATTAEYCPRASNNSVSARAVAGLRPDRRGALGAKNHGPGLAAEGLSGPIPVPRSPPVVVLLAGGTVVNPFPKRAGLDRVAWLSAAVAMFGLAIYGLLGRCGYEWVAVLGSQWWPHRGSPGVSLVRGSPYRGTRGNGGTPFPS